MRAKKGCRVVPVAASLFKAADSMLSKLDEARSFWVYVGGGNG